MKDLSGKKVGFLGDSITAGAVATKEENRFTSVFQTISNSTVFVNGICGTRIARQAEPSCNPEFDQYFASRISDLESKLDYIIIFGGTNDFGHGDAPLGCIEDTMPDTFYGAIYDLVAKIKDKYKDSIIYVVTPLHRLDEYMDFNEWKLPLKKSLKEVANAIKEVSDKLNVKVIDLYNNDELNPFTGDGIKYFSSDGLHPNDLGHKKIAELIYNYMIGQKNE